MSYSIHATWNSGVWKTTVPSYVVSKIHSGFPEVASALLLAQPSIWEVLVMTLDLVLYRMTTVSVSKSYCKWA